MSAFALLKFVLATLPTFLKVAEVVMQAGREIAGKTGPEKYEWALAKLKAELPNLNVDAIHNWIESVVHLLRNMGKPT